MVGELSAVKGACSSRYKRTDYTHPCMAPIEKECFNPRAEWNSLSLEDIVGCDRGLQWFGS